MRGIRGGQRGIYMPFILLLGDMKCSNVVVIIIILCKCKSEIRYLFVFIKTLEVKVTARGLFVGGGYSPVFI